MTKKSLIQSVRPESLRILTVTVLSVHPLGPFPRRMEDSQNLYGATVHAIGQDVWEPCHDKFACSRDSAWTPHVGMLCEHGNTVSQVPYQLGCHAWAVLGKVGRFFVKALQGST